MKRKSKVFPRERKKIVVDWLLRAADASSQRRALAEKWLEEGQYADYRYNVERCDDGRRIYLLRPTWKNKGFDFQANVEGFRSKTRVPKGQTIEMPSHPDIIEDVRHKLESASRVASDLFEALSAVYDCDEPDEVMKRFPRLRKVDHGLAPDKLLKIMKWLFIEQDLTYWLHTGRNKLTSAIEEEAFGIHAPLKA